MTAIAYRDGIMAADTAGWYGEVMFWLTTKIHRLPDGALFAAMGDPLYAEAYIEWRETRGDKPEPPEKDEDFYAILVRRDGVVFMVGRDYVPRRAGKAPFYAIGAHVEFLTGALAAGASAADAVRLCIDHCAHAAGDVQVERLEPAPASG